MPYLLIMSQMCYIYMWKSITSQICHNYNLEKVRRNAYSHVDTVALYTADIF